LRRLKRRIDDVVDRGAAIAAAVKGVLGMERQLGEIDILAGDLDRVDRRFVGRNLDDRLRVRLTRKVGLVELVFAGAERGGDALAPACDLGNHLGFLRARLLEQHGLVGALDDRRQADQRDVVLDDLDLAHVGEPLHERAQAILLKVNFRHRQYSGMNA
jgi:hypothetical protein